MWDANDRHFYANCTIQGKGQIENDPFSDEIVRYASDTRYKAFLEIGTWNGMGSTRSFAKGFSTRRDDYVFYSLECNLEKSQLAARLYEWNDKMHILNEVVWNKEPEDFYRTFPQCLTNGMFKHWNEVDMVNMKLCPLFLERPEVPAHFDVVLLDGGEFTTYYDFQALKHRCTILMLDDVLVDKCKLIVRELEADPSWRILKRGDTRNGFLIAERAAAPSF
jgi:hypothetical protein